MTDLELTTDATIPSNTSTDVTVYEDTDNDGTAENSATQSIGGGTNTYTLTGFDGSSGNGIWIEASVSNTDVTTTASLNSVDVQTADLGFTIDGDLVQEVTIDGTQVSSLTIDGGTVF